MIERRSVVWAIVIMMVSILLSAMLLVSALVVWLAGYFGSPAIPSLLVGIFMAIIALIVYLVALRDVTERLNEWTHTIYDVSRLIRDGYDWVIALLRSATRGGGVG